MFIIEVPFMNLDQIYNSGQCFRWIKLRDGKYAIPHGDKVLKVEQQKQRFIMSCTDEELYNIWYEYFDMGTDYMNVNYKTRGISEEFRVMANRGSGIRILKQDLFEIIVSFMLATATNIPNTKRMIEQIAQKCGVPHKQSLRECGQLKWYEFPNEIQILEKQNKLADDFGLKRKENVLKLCQDIVDGWFDFRYLNAEEYSYEDIKGYLMEFDGIGPKVADCICLYGLHMMNVFPIDTHIKQMLTEDFQCEDYESFRDWYLCDMIGYEGLAQQYMFYHHTNPPKPGSEIIEEVKKRRKKRK